MRRISILAVGLALCMTTVSQAQWTAFNDHVPGSIGVQTHANATTLRIPAATAPATTNGPLKNIATGANLPVTLTITRSATGVGYNANGSSPASGTPLYNTFNGFVYFGAGGDCNVSLTNAQQGSVTYAFSGLNPARRYSFKGGAARGVAAQTTNWTSVQLQGALSFDNAHSAGVRTKAQVGTLETNQVAVTFGQNTIATTGDIVDWENIDPGQDGAFSIVCAHYVGNTNGGSTLATSIGYAITGVRLEELVIGPPIISSQPTNKTVFAGDPYVFTVVAAGSPPLTYQWYKNNAIINGATSTTYSNIAVFPGDNGAQFRVDVMNGSGTTPSSTLTLTVTNSKPLILAQPQDVTASAPQTATFSVSANGSKPISYQWYRNGSMISGATASNYTTAATSIGDSGSKFSVMVINSAGTTNSREAVLTVSTMPVVILPFTNTWRYQTNGADLGTAWRATDYNDSSWPQGRGFIADETAAAVVPYINTPISRFNQQGTHVTTFYFRSHFTLDFDPNSIQLVSSNMIDDGAVFYVNGQEVRRQGMLAAPAVITASTLASAGPGTEGEFTTNVIPSDVLVQGDNVIAVEVHQISTDSSDIVFGNGLTALFLPPSPLGITKQPVDQTVTEAASASFSVEFSGTQPGFQWYKWVNDVPVAIPGATKRFYTITNTAFSDVGFYFVIVSNSVSQVVSGSAFLSVVGDLTGPTLVKADGTASATNVTVSYSEFVSGATATNIANYKITNATSGGTLAITRAVLADGTNVILTSAARVPNANYLLIVNNVRDLSSQSNAIAPNSAIPISSLITLVRLDQGGWIFYDASGGLPPPPSNWNQPSYTPDEFWGGGAALFFFDQSGAELPGPRNTALSQGATTKYFRFSFPFDGSPFDASLRLRHVVDDGAIFYLNGVEFYRFNMPAGPVGDQTPANVTVGTAASSDYIELPVQSLKSGTNLLAVELHGLSDFDIDWVFGAELLVQFSSYATGPVVITRQPQDVTVQEGSPVTFSIGGIAATTFQWRTNGTVIPGATNSSYTIAAVPASWNGKIFSVIASNPSGSVTSSNAVLTVVSDTVPPVLVSAYGTAPTSITASFSEPLSSASATTLQNYKITNSAGANLNISAATPANGTNVVLTVASMSAPPYTLIVNNLRDNSTSANRIASNSTATVGFQLSIPIDAVWRFYTNNIDLMTAWRATAYNDTVAPWTNGPALIADETASLPEPLKTAISRLDNEVYHYTFYFRYHFTAPYPINNLPVTFRHVIDDGALMYLNGQQFHSFNMANDAGSVTYTTEASVNVGDGVYSGPYSTNLNLVAGDNVIAVEVHQNGTASSDVCFGATFSALIPSVVNTVATLPSLQISKSQGTNVVVTWPGTGFLLEKKTVLSPGTLWAPVTNQGPLTYSPATSTNKATFYRLRGR